MTASANKLAPAEIDWLTAMTAAARILREVNDAKQRNKRHPNDTTWLSANSAVAQAWIAYAREITMHARATQ